MTIIKPMEIAFDNIKHIMNDILHLNVIVCYFIYGSVNVPNTNKTHGDFA